MEYDVKTPGPATSFVIGRRYAMTDVGPQKVEAGRR
jgi:hypothetical protein